MRIGIVGYGVVGKTVSDYLEENAKEIKQDLIDPVLENNLTITSSKADAFIICVPAPGNFDTLRAFKGECDDTIIKDVLHQIGTSKPVLLKSTVTPDLIKEYSDNVTYCPEFLRAKHAKEDFETKEIFVVGGTSKKNIDFWKKVFHHKRFYETDRQTASAIKYAYNSFLATKVTFFHELKRKLPPQINYEQMVGALSQMKNIGPSHMKAPNSDGELGFGGECFPKDIEAFIIYINKYYLENSTRAGMGRLDIINYIKNANDKLKIDAL